VTTKTNDLPICADRWCKNRARYTGRRFESDTEQPLCGTHRRIWDKMLANDRRRIRHGAIFYEGNELSKRLAAQYSWPEQQLYVQTGRGGAVELPFELVRRILEGGACVMTAAPVAKATCPYCGRRISLTKLGVLRTHKIRSNGPRCVRSGGRAQ
jgi:hypothetical protein